MYTITKTTQNQYTAYVLADTEANTTATIVPEKGGMLTSFTKNEDEYLWLREPNFSLPERPRCAVPVLFPACGRSPEAGNVLEGKAYPMDIHGFAHSMPWEVVGQDTLDGAALTVRLCANEVTKASYPYDFCVTITYVLNGGSLQMLQTYENKGEGTMPFAFGFHPYFSISDVRNLTWCLNAATQENPDDGSAVPAPEVVDFPYDEEQTTRYYKGVQSPMAFHDEITNHTVAVYFDENFQNAVLWSQCPLGFVCMEPWNGWPGSLGTENCNTLGAGEGLCAEMSIVI